jgi:N-acetylmuramoyl-L-alanine amidase
MRSILENIGIAGSEGKRHARVARLLIVAAAALLGACAGPGGVRNTQKSFTTVVVDAGHGGHDAGTRSSRLILEKDAALDVAKRLDEKLRAAGFRTVMTRKGDYFVTLDKRVSVSNGQSNAIFISVHFNEARPKPGIHGVETYYISQQSTELARRILGKVGAIPGGSPHFMKTARFRVLRLNKNPAVLVECGYLSNRAEASRCATAAYRDLLAGAIAQGIIEQKR